MALFDVSSEGLELSARIVERNIRIADDDEAWEVLHAPGQFEDLRKDHVVHRGFEHGAEHEPQAAQVIPAVRRRDTVPGIHPDEMPARPDSREVVGESRTHAYGCQARRILTSRFECIQDPLSSLGVVSHV